MTESSISKIRIETNANAKAKPAGQSPSRASFKSNLQNGGDPKKVFIKTFGCQMNEYDSNRMLDSLNDSHGVEETQVEADADIILLNTCLLYTSDAADE